MGMHIRTDGCPRLRGRIAEIGVRHVDLAAALGMDPSLLSRYLNGRRDPPEGFQARVLAVLDRLAAAERAADEARQRVLAGDEPPAAVGAGPTEAA